MNLKLRCDGGDVAVELGDDRPPALAAIDRGSPARPEPAQNRAELLRLAVLSSMGVGVANRRPKIDCISALTPVPLRRSSEALSAVASA